MNQLSSTDQLRCPMESLALNELCFDTDIFYDQFCFYGCRMHKQAVYCHNARWEDKPMKCHTEKPRECKGFKKNEPLKEFKDQGND